MEIDGALGAAPHEIVVVDDVVTQGTMLLACASILQAAYSAAHIRGFAVIRTESDYFQRILDPCVGRITRTGSYVNRHP